ncbi:MAG TPA: amino acid racemase [Candidatus Melainabacteria bacterium]|nr:amino acid racemase [Candidatus Melainabacteria bacterium]HIN64831.1 amino acid racemase [Candidatus Obscuribacterales bacterium]
MSFKPLTVGIIGGIGPEAANRLSQMMVELANASSDREHVPVICFNNPNIPSRVDSISGQGENCLPALVETARALVRAGANFLIMPCNCAHFYLRALRDEISVPVLDMIQETVDKIVEDFPGAKSVGLLASTPTLETGLYTRPFSDWGIEGLRPNEIEQQLVMSAIYGPDGIKAGKKETAKENLVAVGNSLAKRGAEVVVTACTEISLVVEPDSLPVPVVDPMRVIAQSAINCSRNGLSKAQAGRFVSTRRSTAAGV